jgi:hypothetical protein
MADPDDLDAIWQEKISREVRYWSRLRADHLIASQPMASDARTAGEISMTSGYS